MAFLWKGGEARDPGYQKDDLRRWFLMSARCRLASFLGGQMERKRGDLGESDVYGQP